VKVMVEEKSHLQCNTFAQDDLHGPMHCVLDTEQWNREDRLFTLTDYSWTGPFLLDLWVFTENSPDQRPEIISKLFH
jgi:hypothetical protein